MTQRYKGGLTGLVWFGAILTGCGGWVDLANPSASGGSASGSAGTAGKPAAVGGAVGTAGTGGTAGTAGTGGGEIIGRGQSGAPTDPPLVNGEGGELLSAGGADAGPAPHGLFQLLQLPAPTRVPAGASAPGVTWSGVSSITAGSLELGALVGSNEFCFKAPGSGYRCDWETQEPFVWTEATGVVALDHLDGIAASGFYSQFVSADGTTVVGTYSTPAGTFGGYFRWTKTGGTTTLGEPPGTDSGGPEHMSTDGSVVSGMAKITSSSKDLGHQPFLWTVAKGYQPLDSFPTWPTGAQLDGMSADGSLLIGETLDSPRKVFRWSPTAGAAQLGTLPGRPTCTFDRASADASTVFGRCREEQGEDQSFVWTHATGITPLELGTTATTCNFSVNALVGDGTVAFGEAQCGGTQWVAARWTAATGVVLLPEPPGGRAEMSADGTNRDGSVAFGKIQPGSASPFPDEGIDGAAPFRWSAAAGLVPLHSLAGDMFSYAYATNPAGDVLIGRSGTQAGASEAVIWDGVGVVGIEAYLTMLGADLHGVHLQSAERVATRDGTTIVQGITDQQNHLGAWIAWLPQRH